MKFRKEAPMNSTVYKQFFLEPTEPWHRRYEALRATFVEQQPLRCVAQHFGVSYGTLCNWVSQFRSQWDTDQRPPFLSTRLADDRLVSRTNRDHRNRKSKLQTSSLCR